MLSENKSVILSPHAVLKRLEEPCLYDIQNDELYELNEDAYQFLLRVCRGESPPVRQEDEEFIRFCLSEKLMAFSEVPLLRKTSSNPSPNPSLRYLELQLTNRCNLQCRHCYIEGDSHQDLSTKRIQKVLEQFGRDSRAEAPPVRRGALAPPLFLGGE